MRREMTPPTDRPRRRSARKTNAGRALVLIALVFLVAGCDRFPGGGRGSRGDETAANGAESESVVRGRNVDTVFAVNVTPAVEGEINNYIEVNGDVQSTASIDVYSNTAGEVVRLYHGIGDTVAAGKVLAEIDPSRPGQNFSLSPVTAPISGTITRLPVRVGSNVSPSAPVAQVSRTNELEIVVQIAERFVSKVERGLPAIIQLDAFPERRFDAVVRELNPVVDPMTRTLEVTLRFIGNAERVRPGMYAEVRIITEQKEGIVKVPGDVLIRRFGETFVYVVTDEETAERRVVNPGIEIDDKLEITDGLEPGERVVYQGQNLLEDGARVRVVDTVEPLTAEDTIR
ncbi:MAG: efflux RND transporter periplasmic adaptor subunit [Spirochaeta sp.]|nr:efflux RND transporter periplasmic adaptor subunit [Spirochaeta sp.]